jgi:arginine N-succinyltransferase
MANFPERFHRSVIAELRGVADAEGHSPFWRHVGQHFFHMPFPQADRLTMTTDKQFIADLMPQVPIYINLLAPEAQKVIGQPNETSAPAMKILLREGFQPNQTVDIFDAGPTLEASQEQIKTIVQNQHLVISALTHEKLNTPQDPYLLANTSLDFKATIGSIKIDHQQQSVILHQETADLLQVKCGDSIRVISLTH